MIAKYANSRAVKVRDYVSLINSVDPDEMAIILKMENAIVVFVVIIIAISITLSSRTNNKNHSSHLDNCERSPALST
jgi:hypothetical protein